MEGMNGYATAAEDSMNIVDRMTAVGLESGLAIGGLAKAISLAAESASAGGTSIERLVGYIAAVGENSNVSMADVGDSFKNIYERMDRVKSNKLGDGSDDGIADMEEELNRLGVYIRDSANQYRDFDDVLDDVGARWNELSQKEQNALSIAVAGSSQRESFMTLMDNYSKALQYSSIATDSAGASMEQYGIYQNTVEAKTNELTAAFEALSLHTFSNDLYKGILNATIGIVELVDKSHLLKGALAGVVTVEIAKFSTGILAGANSLRTMTAAFGKLKIASTIRDFKEVGHACKGLSDQQLKLVLSTKGLNDTKKIAILTGMGMTKAAAKEKLEMMGLTAAQLKATQATFSLSGAVTALKTALAVNPIGIAIMAVTAAVSVATMAYNKYKQDQEEMLQSIQESTNKFSEQSDYIEEAAGRYTKLYNELKNINTTEERQCEIKQELLSLQKELNDKYGDEYGRINLVTDAYEDQKKAILDLKKEEANKLLNELGPQKINNIIDTVNQKGYHYLTPMHILDDSEKGKALKEVVAKYSDKGVKTLDTTVEDGKKTFVVTIHANPRDTENVVNAFMSDLREKASELGNEHMFDYVIESSKNVYDSAVNKLKDIGKTYDEILNAQMIIDPVLNDKKQAAQESVAAFNQSLINGDEAETAGARENIKTVQDNLNLSEQEAEVYGPVFEDIFSQANTDAYDFKIALSDTSTEAGLLADKISNMRLYIDSEPLNEVRQELTAMSQDGSINLTARKEIDSSELTEAGWGELTTRKETVFAQQFNSEDGSRSVLVTPILPDGTVLSPDELAQYAEKLLRGEEIDADVKIAMFNGNNSEAEAEEYAKNIQTLTQQFYNKYSKSNKAAQGIKMDETDFLSYINAADETDINNPFFQLKKYAADCQMSVEQVAKELVKIGAIRKDLFYEESEPFTYDQTLEKLDTLSNPFQTLKTVYLKAVDDDTDFELDGLSELNEKFKEVDGIGDYIKNIEEARGDTEKTEQAFDDLTNAYLKQTGILDIVNEGNKDLIANALAEMGIANANVLVQQALEDNLAKVEAQKYIASDASFDLAAATREEIDCLVEEGIVSQEAAVMLARFALEKARTNEDKINTSDDIDQLINLANTAMASEAIMAKLNSVRAAAGRIDTLGDLADPKDIEAVNSFYEQFNSGQFEWKYKPLNAADFKIAGSSKDRESSTGGRGNIGKKEFSEEINHIDRAMEVSKRRLKNYKDALEDALTLEEKDAAIDDIIKESEDQFKQMTSISQFYTNKAAEILAQIPEDIRDKVKNGAEEIENLNDENVSKLIKQFKDFDASANDADQKVRDLKNSIHDMKVQKIQIQIEGLERTKSRLERLQDQYETAISAVTSSIQTEIDEVNSYYDSQIDNVQKQIDALDEQNDKLEIQRNLEEALYNLRRAENQRTNRIYREGQGFVYEADQDAVREAQESYDSAELDKTKYDLEQIIDRLEEERSQEVDYLTNIMDTWEGIADSFERMADMRMADELFGTDNWLEDILNGDTDLFDEMQENFGNVFEGIFNTDQVIESLNDLKDWVENGEMSDDTALAIMNQQLYELGDNATAQSEVMGEGFNSIYTSAENAKTLSADTYAAWTENLRLFQEETLPICEGLVTQFNTMADAVVLAAERARQAAADMESLGGGDGDEGVTSTKEPIRRSSNSVGPGVKHHRGILNGTNGNPNTEDKRVKGLRILSTEPLKANEVPIIALDDEVSLTREQQEMTLRNFQTAMAPRINLSSQAYSMIQPIKQEPSSVEYNFSGGIHITEAQNVTDIARGVKAGMLKQALDQELYKR